MADYFELLKTRRAIRDFEDREVPLETVREIIGESCLAPSAHNGQPWQFIIVNKKEVLGRLSEDIRKNLLDDLEKSGDPHLKSHESIFNDPDFNFFYNAPCLVYILGPKGLSSLHRDCSLAGCYFMFSAAARGLGTCWAGVGRHVRDPELLKLIGLPQDYEIVAPIIVGYPKSIPEPPERKEPVILKIITE
jgi:nitroreductase